MPSEPPRGLAELPAYEPREPLRRTFPDAPCETPVAPEPQSPIRPFDAEATSVPVAYLAPVDDEDDRIRFLHGDAYLILDVFYEQLGINRHGSRAAANGPTRPEFVRRFQAAGVDDDEADSIPFAIAVDSIARRAGDVLDDSRPLAGKPVEQG